MKILNLNNNKFVGIPKLFHGITWYKTMKPWLQHNYMNIETDLKSL